MNFSVSVIIPNYLGEHLLPKTLPAVLAMLRTGDELIISDDASPDSSWQWLTTFFRINTSTQKLGQLESLTTKYQTSDNKQLTITLLRRLQNGRFAKNANDAVAHAQHPICFLLNNDAQPHADVLQWTLPHFIDNQVFAVGCLEEDRGLFSGKTAMTFSRGLFVHSRAKDQDLGEMPWVSGGNMFFSRQKWQELGGFDIAFSPAYWEDIDLSFRAREKGWKIIFEPKAKVVHHHESTNTEVFGQKKMVEMSWRNADVFVQKHGTPMQKLQYYLWHPYWMYQRWKIVHA